LREPPRVVAFRRARRDRQRRAGQRLELLHRRVETRRVAARDYHGARSYCRRACDGEADPAPAAGDDRDLSGQGLGLGHAAPPWMAATAFSSEAGSSTLWPRMPSSVRLSRPVSTRPGPTSRNAVAPTRCSRYTQSFQRPGLATCCTRNGFTSSAVVVKPASTFRTTAIRGALTVTRSSAAARRSAAGFMSAQWKGALTGSITLFLAPRAAAPATARSTAARCPAMAIWPGELMLATPTTSPCAASAHT